MVEWKSSSVLGVIATSESGTHGEKLIVGFVSFVAEEPTDFDCLRWREPVSGRDMHPPKSSAFTAHCFAN